MTLIADAIASIRQTAANTARTRGYYDGPGQATPFSKDTAWTNPHRNMIQGLRDNQCRSVIDLTVDRLQLTGFTTTTSGDVIQEALAARAYDLWQANRMGLRSRQWFTSLEVTGAEGAIVVWPDTDGNVRLWVQDPEQVAFEADEERPERLLWLAKRYWDGTASVMIMYWPDSVETWKSSSPLHDPDAATYTLTNEQVNPFGFVPAVATGLGGYSDIDSAIPLQDLLNQALANSAIASLTFSLPIRVWSGLEMGLDPETGEKVAPFELGTQRTAWLPPAAPGETAPDVKQLSGEAPTALLAEADSHRRAIAAVTRTPVHLLLQAGDFPSGEALRTAEAPFVAKVQARQALYGAALSDALSMAVVIDTYLSTGVMLARPDFETVWTPAGSDSMESNAKVVEMLVGVGVPLDVALVRVMGWSAEDAAVIGQRADEAAQRLSLRTSGIGL